MTRFHELGPHIGSLPFLQILYGLYKSSHGNEGRGILPIPLRTEPLLPAPEEIF